MQRHTKYCRLFSEDEKTLLKFLYPIASKRLLENVFGVTYTQLTRKAQHLGVKRLFKPNCKGDMWKFLQDTPESYYWLGFLLSDGKISKDRISLALAEEDKAQVQKFADFLGLTHLVRTHGKCNFIGQKYNDKVYYGFVASCRNCYYVPLIIEKFDIKDRKTYNCPDANIYRKIPFELFLSLLIGYIDGDGCIQSQNQHKRSIIVGFNVHKNWFSFLEMIQERLSEHFGINCNPPIIYSESMVRSHIGKMEILVAMKKFIMEHNLPALARKWDKVNENVLRRTKRNRPILDSELLAPSKLGVRSTDLTHNF